MKRNLHTTLTSAAAKLSTEVGDTVEAERRRQERYETLVNSDGYRSDKLLADAWCAAFVWRKLSEKDQEAQKVPPPITEADFRRYQRTPKQINERTVSEITRLANQYSFFHWHLAFPNVFDDQKPDDQVNNSVMGAGGGFHVVLGNPPWEHTELKEKEWFAARSPDIAEAMTGSLRKGMIEALNEENPRLLQNFLEARRYHDAWGAFAGSTGRYPLCGRGRINTYAVFAELFRQLTSHNGCAGIIVPSGIATDDTTKLFFQDLIEQHTLISLFDFENRTRKLFPTVDSRMKFSLLTMGNKPTHPERAADFVFFALDTPDLYDPERRFSLTSDDIKLLNPNTRTCPIFRSRKDAEITKSIYRRVPVLINDGDPEGNPWNISFKQGLFNMANDSNLFRTARPLQEEGYVRDGNIYASPYDRYLPLYEAKMFHQFDHRWATYDSDVDARDVTLVEKQLPGFVSQPRYWIREEIVDSAIPKYPESLYRALLLDDLGSIERVLFHWLSGYYFNHGDRHNANRTLIRSHSFPLHRTLATLIPTLDAARHAAKLESMFNLTQDDIKRLEERNFDPLGIANDLIRRYSPKWFVSFRDICRNTDERTVIASVLPRNAIGHTSPLLFCKGIASMDIACLVANLSSFVLDYAARQKISGTHLTYGHLSQLPVFRPETYSQVTPWQPDVSLQLWIFTRVLELTYTAADLQPFANDCAYLRSPFVWNEMRRFQIRCEIDAAFCFLYRLRREEVEHILDTFSIVKRKDETSYGYFRTKETILSVFDSITQSAQSPYQSLLMPSPEKNYDNAS